MSDVHIGGSHAENGDWVITLSTQSPSSTEEIEEYISHSERFQSNPYLSIERSSSYSYKCIWDVEKWMKDAFRRTSLQYNSPISVTFKYEIPVPGFIWTASRASSDLKKFISSRAKDYIESSSLFEDKYGLLDHVKKTYHDNKILSIVESVLSEFNALEYSLDYVYSRIKVSINSSLLIGAASVLLGTHSEERCSLIEEDCEEDDFEEDEENELDMDDDEEDDDEDEYFENIEVCLDEDDDDIEKMTSFDIFRDFYTIDDMYYLDEVLFWGSMIMDDSGIFDKKIGESRGKYWMQLDIMKKFVLEQHFNGIQDLLKEGSISKEDVKVYETHSNFLKNDYELLKYIRNKKSDEIKKMFTEWMKNHSFMLNSSEIAIIKSKSFWGKND